MLKNEPKQVLWGLAKDAMNLHIQTIFCKEFINPAGVKMDWTTIFFKKHPNCQFHKFQVDAFSHLQKIRTHFVGHVSVSGDFPITQKKSPSNQKDTPKFTFFHFWFFNHFVLPHFCHVSVSGDFPPWHRRASPTSFATTPGDHAELTNVRDASLSLKDTRSGAPSLFVVNEWSYGENPINS